jgi:hypothetical protein
MTPIDANARQEVQVTVDYLPATEDFRKDYPSDTTLEVIRTDAKNFFGVQDRQERDTYYYFLAYKGKRVQNTAITLLQLIGQHVHSAHFALVEQITAGGV